MPQTFMLQLDDERAEWLKAEAEAQGVDVSTIVAQLIDASEIELSAEASEVLDVFKALRARPGAMVEGRDIAARWAEEGGSPEDMASGLQELVDLDLVEAHGDSRFSLTEEGYEVIAE